MAALTSPHRHKPLTALLTILALLLTAPTLAEIHKWVDEQGRVHYSDNKPQNQASEVVELKEPMTYTHTTVYDLPDFDGFIETTSRKTVVMYSTERCTWCKKAKQYFIANGIPHVEKDVNKSEKYRNEWKRLGGTGVPVILVERKKIHGFNRKKFDNIYYQQ